MLFFSKKRKKEEPKLAPYKVYVGRKKRYY